MKHNVISTRCAVRDATGLSDPRIAQRILKDGKCVWPCDSLTLRGPGGHFALVEHIRSVTLGWSKDGTLEIDMEFISADWLNDIMARKPRRQPVEC